MRQYEVFEIQIKGQEPKGSHVDVDITGFFEMNGKKTEVKGFYAGADTWLVRFCPEEAGTCNYQIKGHDGAGETFEQTGSVECEPTSGRHGIVKPDGTHFRYADGTWFYPFGTTVYALSHQEDSLVKQTFETLAQAPFNKVRMCVFPKHYEYNDNEPPCYAFKKTDGKWDVNKPDPVFWNRLESHIARLDGLGIQCDLILFHPYDNWGFSKFTREEALIYLDYAIRRLSAYPNIWWSMANEYDLLEYEMEDWECFAGFLHEHDPYGHLLSCHQIVRPWDFANPYTTHICHQTSDIEFLSGEIKKYQKPLMVDECCYEGNIPMNWGNISGFELAHRFWTICMQGGYCTHGETFLNEEEILWWSKGGKLAGESPARIGFLKQILEALPGPLVYSGKDYTEESFEVLKRTVPEEQKQDRFVRLMLDSPWKEAKGMLNAGRECEANCGDEVYIKYYGKHCTCQGKLVLPENHCYDVEVIDIWEMTRNTILEDVTGTVQIPLPGKEGIAVMAKRRNPTISETA